VLRSREFVFLVVGGLNTVLGLLLFAVLHTLLGAHVPYLGVLALTYTIGTVIAFTTQRLLVFRVQGQVATDFSRFVLVQLGSVALNAVLLTFIVEVVGLPVVLSQCIALAIVVLVSYYLHLHVSFRRSPEQR
jgi:putative flippase GtrA